MHIVLSALFYSYIAPKDIFSKPPEAERRIYKPLAVGSRR